MKRRLPGKTLLGLFSTFGLIFAIVWMTMAIWSIADDLRGSETAAEVVDVEHSGARTFLTVRFTTNSGEACESRVRVTVDANRAVHTGEHVGVHYARSSPCLRVRESGDHSMWLFPVVGVVLPIVFGIMAYAAWRRPRPALPPRYAGMP
ncbi:hypothetical protein OOK41_24935 [Micromonospora sp. NBC_01655]|uniref:DUF3592 domain-containing protein n=1 Tax=Micromonospora sp. NBC_01655 TaxID=2975983 RepID=UPI00224F12E8|nr:DUF3592 domain-containing protein [Micromonospora sp. NBC_01655]MCX4473510.1 hypothetical protein [Micromonospora sp. NBC_01655]